MLGEDLIDDPSFSEFNLVVAYNNKVSTNKPAFFQDLPTTHGHEEADTQIPLHVLDTLNRGTGKEIIASSPDTDVLVLLIDLAANGHLGPLTQFRNVGGKGKNKKSFDIKERAHLMGQEKARALVGFHYFSGADWGGKFVGVSKQKWVSYFLLAKDKALFDAFTALGQGAALAYVEQLDDKHVTAIQSFVHTVYGGSRWKLFKTRKQQHENLPPTRSTLEQHILRSDYVVRVAKSYSSWSPTPIVPQGRGWTKEEGHLLPAMCNKPPAPPEVMQYTKCGCKSDKGCGANCSCQKLNFSCTSLCDCSCESAASDLHYFDEEGASDDDDDFHY